MDDPPERGTAPAGTTGFAGLLAACPAGGTGFTCPAVSAGLAGPAGELGGASAAGFGGTGGASDAGPAGVSPAGHTGPVCAGPGDFTPSVGSRSEGAAGGPAGRAFPGMARSAAGLSGCGAAAGWASSGKSAPRAEPGYPETPWYRPGGAPTPGDRGTGGGPRTTRDGHPGVPGRPS
ncbi:hypothetical protein Sfulv_08160 [Streptomyces fulvorobeus]|uniref:Uncharacterized protein n=1 Tax=Streptomyces fulvorobeus TaxID=284028 RepID=A0A7J0C0H7_9ACTN|nr:hypothetical protein Sfulv_08160 [Streptomyces fulvorobeus]